jgi:hypothetical protein
MSRGSQRGVKIAVFVMPEVVVGNPFFSKVDSRLRTAGMTAFEVYFRGMTAFFDSK